MEVSCLSEYLFSATLPAVWFPKQLSELLIQPHIHLKEIGLSPANLLIIFLKALSFTPFEKEISFFKSL